MADPTLTNSNVGNSTLATVDAGFGFTATSGRLLLLAIAADDYTPGAPSGWSIPTNGEQETWLGGYLYYKVSNGTETTVQYTIGSATGSAWIVAEFDNVDATPFDIGNGTLTQPPGDNTATTPSVVPTTGRRLAIAAVGGMFSQATDTFTGVGSWTNSYAEARESFVDAGDPNDCVGLGWLVLDGNGSSSTSTAATFTTSGTGLAAWTAIIAVFKVAAGAPAGKPRTTMTLLGVG